MMNDVFKLTGLVAALALLLIIRPVVGATFGAFGGWVVGFFWGAIILATLQAIGLPPEIEMWQLGCVLGFVGTYLSTSVSSELELKKDREDV